jgi:hypothetical protein
VYVEDITDMNELNELLAEVQDRLLADPLNEQAEFDMEDITERMALLELDARIQKRISFNK